MKTPTKPQIIISSLLIAATLFLLYQTFSARSASYSWFQTDWSGGASTTAVARHPGDTSGWTKFQSKDAVVDAGTPGQVSLSSTTASWVETTTADFSAGTKVATVATSGKVIMLKPAGVPCAAGAECFSGYCAGTGVCAACAAVTYESQTYQAVLIGTQCWMASNLNVGVFTLSSSTGSTHSDVTNNAIIEKYCYNNDTANCTTDGGLYDWNEAMGYVTTAGTQGICPAGWHIPTDNQQYILENYLKDNGQTCDAGRNGVWDCASAGTKLKVGGTSGLNFPLAGYRNTDGSVSNRLSYAFWWSSSVSGGGAWDRGLGSSDATVGRDADSQFVGFSVRCLKN